MKRPIPFLAVAICASVLLTSCATHPNGERMTIAEQWKAMAARQDAAARSFVDTSSEFGHRDQSPPSGGNIRDRFQGTEGL